MRQTRVRVVLPQLIAKRSRENMPGGFIGRAQRKRSLNANPRKEREISVPAPPSPCNPICGRNHQLRKQAKTPGRAVPGRVLGQDAAEIDGGRITCQLSLAKGSHSERAPCGFDVFHFANRNAGVIAGPAGPPAC